MIIQQFPGDVKYATQTIDYKIDYGDPDTDLTTVLTNVYNTAETACIERFVVAYCIEIPTAPNVVYATRYAYIASQTEMSKERNQDMKAQITFAPARVTVTVNGSPTLIDGGFIYDLNAPSPYCGDDDAE
jgi:hypothetical protein